MLDAALRFLEVRQRSTSEVRRRLLSAGYETALVEGAITRLQELAVLDDDAFARAWVESRDRAHPRGRRALGHELSLKGVERSTIAAILDERDAKPGRDGVEPEAIAAGRLIQRHLRTLSRVTDPRVRRQRAYALLARNGFDPETCRLVAASVDQSDAAASDGTPPDD